MFNQRQSLSGRIPGDPEGEGDMKNVLAVLAVLVMVPCLMLAGSLSGTVVDRSTSQPIADALVTLHVLLPDSIAYPDTSGASGEYAIADIVTGNEIYVVMAGKPGYKPYYFRYDAIGVGSYTFDIVLEPDTASSGGGGGGGGDSTEVSGQVLGRDRVSGVLTPLAGAEVRLVSGAQEWNVVTGVSGSLRLARAVGELCSDCFRVRLWHGIIGRGLCRRGRPDVRNDPGQFGHRCFGRQSSSFPVPAPWGVSQSV